MITTITFPIPVNYEDVILSTLCSVHPKINKHYSKAMKLLKEGRCCFCGKLGKTDMHHIIKRQEGGRNSKDNLIELCRLCHNRVDSGVIVLKEQGEEFIFLIRKRNKILRKIYRTNPIRFSEQYFYLIEKHIYLDSYLKDPMNKSAKH
jgi:hypothetical protein